MPDASSLSPTDGWTRAADADRVQPSQPIAVKIEGRHIALFRHGDEVLACNNRCPHEGYPLSEGALDGDCVLTCNWHNWKFDLRTGTTLYGGDQLRVYPVEVRDGAVWVDLSGPPRDARIGEAMAHLDVAIGEFDVARIARELARLGKAGAEPEQAVRRAIIGTHDRLRDGMSHAYAAADAWFRLRDVLDDDAMRLACATEAIAYIAFDTLREKQYPYADQQLPWDARAFASAVESQREDLAIALVEGALQSGLHFADLEATLASAALAHYNDFGHTLIYLDHVGRLIARLGVEVERPLLRAWIRSLIYATREDLLPDFRGYRDALASWMALEGASASPSAAQAGTVASDMSVPDARIVALADALEGQSVRRALEITLDHASLPPLALHAALLEAASRHLLRFDEAHALRTDNSVADNVGWLDFSHALTFGHALRRIAARHPALWPQGLLQLAMFVGRTNTWLDPSVTSPDVLRQWVPADETQFHSRAIAQIVDHGLGLPILPAHWLKTWTAVRETIDDGVPPPTRAALLAAVNRLLAVRFKQRHPLRIATQALRSVERED